MHSTLLLFIPYFGLQHQGANSLQKFGKLLILGFSPQQQSAQAPFVLEAPTATIYPNTSQGQPKLVGINNPFGSQLYKRKKLQSFRLFFRGWKQSTWYIPKKCPHNTQKAGILLYWKQPNGRCHFPPPFGISGKPMRCQGTQPQRSNPHQSAVQTCAWHPSPGGQTGYGFSFGSFI